MSKYNRFSSIVAAILVLDQTTKIWIDRNFFLFESKEVFKGFFNITYIRNSGAAFGFLSDVDSIWVQVFFIAIAIVALITILFIVKGIEENDIWSLSAFASIFGGALGNFIDRVLRGEVIDFLDFYWGTYHWPFFNVADSCITIGILRFIVLHFFYEQPQTE